eukprot:3582693-Rhodomonas_salina.2
MNFRPVPGYRKGGKESPPPDESTINSRISTGTTSASNRAGLGRFMRIAPRRITCQYLGTRYPGTRVPGRSATVATEGRGS